MSKEVQILVPRMGLSVEEVTIVEWMIEDGQSVTKGQTVCTVETDKSTIEIEAPETGILFHAADQAEVCELGAPLGIIETEE